MCLCKFFWLFGLMLVGVGAQGVWLEQYKKHDKTLHFWEKGCDSVIVNLCQNPMQRLIINSLCPTLLRAGSMFVISNPNNENQFEERCLAPQEIGWSCVRFYFILYICLGVLGDYDDFCES